MKIRVAVLLGALFLAGSAWSQEAWNGSWTRTGGDSFSQATLEISKATAAGFEFDLNASNGGNMGQITGSAKLENGQGVFKDEENACTVTFSRTETQIELKTTDGCSYYAGNGVGFEGSFQQGKVAPPKMTLFGQGLLQDQAQEQLFVQLLGGDYEAFVNSFQITFEDQDLDGLGGQARSGGVRGLFSIQEGAFLITPQGKIWAAFLDGDNIAYYTNVPEFAQKLPKTLQAWRDKFPEKKLIFKSAAP